MCGGWDGLAILLLSRRWEREMRCTPSTVDQGTAVWPAFVFAWQFPCRNLSMTFSVSVHFLECSSSALMEGDSQGNPEPPVKIDAHLRTLWQEHQEQHRPGRDLPPPSLAFGLLEP